MEGKQTYNVHTNLGLLSSGISLKSTLSGKPYPRSFPIYRRSSSSRARATKSEGSAKQWIMNNRILYCLLLIALWAYLGFYFQSRWAHDADQSPPGSIRLASNKMTKIQAEDRRTSNFTFPKRASKQFAIVKARRKRTGRRLDVKQELGLPMRNSTYGFLVGPFGREEDEIYGWSREQTIGNCERKGKFARIVRSRRFLLVLHDLSMTGAPLSMLELAAELQSCGASVSVVALSRKGGLMAELSRKKTNLIDDKEGFKSARKADLVIVGSAVCAQWIENFISYSPNGGSKTLWWIMENRREYFERARHVIERVKTVTFLSEIQSETWHSWFKELAIKLRNPTAVVPLSVNDELAFAAGLPSSLNSPSSPPDKMTTKRKRLRDRVRNLMGLSDNDVLMMTLSSVNPGKGQLPVAESVERIQREGNHSVKLLIGSAGSKGNKESYVNEILGFINSHPKLKKSVIWSRSTTRVAALYSAADVYVMNSQGMGETFGRVTVEAMAFGLPVIGTDAGGTREIIEHNVSGLLYPTGRAGTSALEENLRFLLRNSSVRERMGENGLRKVKMMYLKRHMYFKLAQVLYKAMS